MINGTHEQDGGAVSFPTAGHEHPTEPRTVRGTAEVPASPWWQSAPCPSWCTGGHHDHESPSDRTCFGELGRTNLTLHDPQIWVDAARELHCDPPTLDVFLRQEWREVDARICVDVNENATVLELTTREARALAARLEELLRVVDSGVSR